MVEISAPEILCRIELASIDLFHSLSNASLETVQKASAFFARHGADYHVQNLQWWSAAALLNSCDEALRSKVEEKVMKYPPEHQTGPVHWCTSS